MTEPKKRTLRRVRPAPGGGYEVAAAATPTPTTTPRARRTKKDAPMARTKKTRNAVKDAVIHGGKVAAVDSIGEALLDGAKLIIGEDNLPEGFLSTKLGRDITKAVMATAVHAATTHEGLSEFIPKEDAVGAACELQLEACARDLIQPNLAKLQPLLMKLGRLGALAAESDDQ